jgi:phosphohistidine phosphatase SixA
VGGAEASTQRLGGIVPAGQITRMKAAPVSARRAALAVLVLPLVRGPGAAPRAEERGLRPVTVEEPAGQALVARLRAGGLVLFIRHADTRGEPCDASFRVGDRAGQRNLSAAGRAQAARLGEAIRALGIPVAPPVLAGPVFRARDTAELAFGGAGNVRVTEGLLADDFARDPPQLARLLAEHRRLLGEAVPGGANRVLVGHRTPAIMVAGEAVVGGRAFPEGAALVIEPGGAPGRFTVLGVLELAPIPGAGFHGC